MTEFCCEMAGSGGIGEIELLFGLNFGEVACASFAKRSEFYCKKVSTELPWRALDLLALS